MDIKNILKIQNTTQKEMLGMILSNRIDYYMGDKFGAAISTKNFNLLIDDILLWKENVPKKS